MSYQPVWVKGKTISEESSRDAYKRYFAIRQEIINLDVSNPRVLDFGAWSGYFSFRLAEEVEAQVVAIDDNPALTHAGRLNANPRVQIISERFTSRQLIGLGHFDVVLALSVIHHSDEWYALFRQLFDMSTLLFIETAHPDEDGVINKEQLLDIYNKVSGYGKVITRTPGIDKRFTREIRAIYTQGYR